MPWRASLALAFATIAASGATVRAQTAPGPGESQVQPQAPWPGSAQSAPMQAPRPGTVQPAQPLMGAPGGGATMVPGAGPIPEQLACLREFTQYRQDVEKRGLAAKSAGDSHKATREEMCELVVAYSAAEVQWIKFSADNMTKCGIPKEVVEQLKKSHAHTDEARTKICAAGPAGGAAPTLSDAPFKSPRPTPLKFLQKIAWR